MSASLPEISEVILDLRRAGLIATDAPVCRALTGGVSSEIIVIEDGPRRLVVKRALPRLRVADEWFADVSRNGVEQEYFKTVDQIAPGSVPRILHSDPAAGWFAMEFIGDPFVNWKTLLLANRAVEAHAERAGEVLGRIHSATWKNPSIQRAFATLANFRQLRIDPYLTVSAERVPRLAALIRAEAARLGATSLALVHGDFSPKNLLVSDDGLVILDAEVAWFGDPAFDTAFLLTHFHLKALLHAHQPDQLLKLIPAFWRSYVAAMGAAPDPTREDRTVRLLLCLMLARVKGKSPAEYLTTSTQRQFINEFVQQHLPQPPRDLASLTAAWQDGLRRL